MTCERHPACGQRGRSVLDMGNKWGDRGWGVLCRPAPGLVGAPSAAQALVAPSAAQALVAPSAVSAPALVQTRR